MKTPNSSPAYTNRQRRPADRADHANPGYPTMSNATKAAATSAAYVAGSAAASAGWVNAASAAYDAANAVYRTEYGFTVQDYASANLAAYAALDLIFAPVK